jgi:peptide/nickel transport system permease protein
MIGYIIQRILLLIPTLFCIILINFLIINLAPGEPVFITYQGQTGEASRKENAFGAAQDSYLQFREFFGLTKPILFNTWPRTSKETLLKEIAHAENSKDRVLLGDKACYVVPQLLEIAQDTSVAYKTREKALALFFRGATPFTSQTLEHLQKRVQLLDQLRTRPINNPQEFDAVLKQAVDWYRQDPKSFFYPTDGLSFLVFAFSDTRFMRYMKRVLTLDFGPLRNDPNKSVTSEVAARLKYSLTLSVFPTIMTFLFCFFFGMLMAVFRDTFFDHGTNTLFLMLWAVPVFVAAPLLIDSVALHHTYPFTDLPFPIRGFSSDEATFSQLTSWQRLLDIARHITLPLFVLFYGNFAAQSRLSRAVFLDTMRHDFVRTAKAKGVGLYSLYFEHIGKYAALPLVTSVAGSFGLILGGSVIVETIFEIHGFGKFFYDAIINRDYNVMMFSALVGSFLALIGYLVADIVYMVIDPRVTLKEQTP